VPDGWLLRLRVDPRGIDWPLLRRRLWRWAQVIPADDPRDPATRYADLARSFGPLADAHTHGFRTVGRIPWQPKRAAAVLHVALHGPLAWLGLIGTGEVPTDDPQGDLSPDALRPTHAATPQHRMRTPPRPSGQRQRRASRWRWPDTDLAAPADQGAPVDTRPEFPAPAAESWVGATGVPEDPPAHVDDLQNAFAWHYRTPGVIRVPHAAPHAATLRLLPFVRWDSVDAVATQYRITAASLARARSQGWSLATCRQLLEAQAGNLPDGWCAALADASPPMRLVQTAVLLVDAPAVLERAGRARSVRRYLDQRIAPGIALVRLEDRAPLTRALARQGIACVGEDQHDGGMPMQTRADEHESEPVVRTRPYPSASDDRAGTPAYPADLSAGERAALLLACAFYRQHAPSAAPLLPNRARRCRRRIGRSATTACRIATNRAASCAHATGAHNPNPAQCRGAPAAAGADLRHSRAGCAQHAHRPSACARAARPDLVPARLLRRAPGRAHLSRRSDHGDCRLPIRPKYTRLQIGV